MNGLWVDSDMDHEKSIYIYMVQLDNDGTGYRLYKCFLLLYKNVGDINVP